MKTDHEVRKLNWQLKQLQQQNSAQGETIYRLRCVIEELRALSSKSERGDLRRLERQVPELKAELAREQAMTKHQSDIIKALNEKVRALDESRDPELVESTSEGGA